MRPGRRLADSRDLAPFRCSLVRDARTSSLCLLSFSETPSNESAGAVSFWLSRFLIDSSDPSYAYITSTAFVS